jgi:hypothetical protein
VERWEIIRHNICILRNGLELAENFREILWAEDEDREKFIGNHFLWEISMNIFMIANFREKKS